jgi:hypothetical protein
MIAQKYLRAGWEKLDKTTMYQFAKDILDRYVSLMLDVDIPWKNKN